MGAVLFSSGDVAQLGERSIRIAEVRGSSPLVSTKLSHVYEEARTNRPGLFCVCLEEPGAAAAYFALCICSRMMFAIIFACGYGFQPSMEL